MNAELCNNYADDNNTSRDYADERGEPEENDMEDEEFVKEQNIKK